MEINTNEGDLEDVFKKVVKVMILNVEKLFTYLFLSIQLFLITGPAIPYIIITIGIIFSIFYLFFLKK